MCLKSVSCMLEALSCGVIHHLMLCSSCIESGLPPPLPPLDPVLYWWCQICCLRLDGCTAKVSWWLWSIDPMAAVCRTPESYVGWTLWPLWVVTTVNCKLQLSSFITVAVQPNNGCALWPPSFIAAIPFYRSIWLLSVIPIDHYHKRSATQIAVNRTTACFCILTLVFLLSKNVK